MKGDSSHGIRISSPQDSTEVRGEEECMEEESQPSVAGRSPSPSHAEDPAIDAPWGRGSDHDDRATGNTPLLQQSSQQVVIPVENGAAIRNPLQRDDETSHDGGKPSVLPPTLSMSKNSGVQMRPAVSTTWADDGDDAACMQYSRPAASGMPPASINTVAVDVDERITQGKWADDGEEPLVKQQETKHCTGPWGSEDEEDYDYPLSAFRQPFRMGAAAAGLLPTHISPKPAATLSAFATASWAEDGEMGENDGSDRNVSSQTSEPLQSTRGEGAPSPTGNTPPATVHAYQLSPARHSHRDDSRSEVVAAPLWTSRAQQGRSQLGGQNVSWANGKSTGGGDTTGHTSPRGADNSNHAPKNGLQRYGRNAARLSSLEEVNLATKHPARTDTPSQWFSSLRRHFGRHTPSAAGGRGADGNGNDNAGRSPWDIEPAIMPSLGDSKCSRWSEPNAGLQWRSQSGTKDTPTQKAQTRGNFNNYQSPEIVGVRARCPWFQRASRSMGRVRRRVLEQRRSPKKRNQDDRDNDHDTGVRVWGWRDQVNRISGLTGRLVVCTLAVCALWLTSLSVVADVTGSVIPSPTLSAVIDAVAHAYFIAQEQREAAEACVARQSVYCDSDFEVFGALAREESAAALSSTAATYEQASSWTESCKDSLREVEVSVKTWLAQGTGHSLLFSGISTSNTTGTNSRSSGGGGGSSSSSGSGSVGTCTSSERALVADLFFDVSPDRDYQASATTDFTLQSAETILALSSYAVERSVYDAAYVESISAEVSVDTTALVENITFEAPRSIVDSLAELPTLGDTLVSCVSLRENNDDERDDGTESACPVDAARQLADEARTELDRQLEIVRAGFQEYEDKFQEYKSNVEEAYSNWITFYIGVTNYLEASRVTLSGQEWALLTEADFVINTPSVPSSRGIFFAADVLSSAEIWDRVEGAFVNYSAGVASISSKIVADVDALGKEWQSAVTGTFSNLSVKLTHQEYDPPTYANSSTETGSNILLQSANFRYQAVAKEYHSSLLAFLDGLGPVAPNLSFPAAPSLNSTLRVGGTSTVISNPIEYNFATLSGTTTNFDGWIVSLGNVALWLVVADYLFRAASSLRMFVRFWGRSGLGLPDADIRVDRTVASAGGIISNVRMVLMRVLLHPATTMLIFCAVLSIILYNMASIYVPLFQDYKAGCIDKTQNGSTFSQNAYSIAYNYAADKGNRDKWNYLENHTSQRGALCVELTAEVRQYLVERDTQLRAMFEEHYDDVTVAATVDACIDVEGMDALFAEACCGYDGYGNNTCAAEEESESSLQCPLNYESGTGKVFAPLGTLLSDPSCSWETLEAANWEVEDGISLDCDTIPACQMTCAGPNQELMQAVTIHAGCMAEWLFHAGLVRLTAIIIMFMFLNISRIVLVGGLVQLNWRAGELIVKNPQEKAEQTRESTANVTTKETAQGGGQRGMKEILSTLGNAFNRARSRKAPAGTFEKNVERGSEEEEQLKKDFRVDGDTPAATGAPKKQPPTFKRVLFGAIEEALNVYERGARRRVLLGVLLNVPWLAVLWFGRGHKTAYNMD